MFTGQRILFVEVWMNFVHKDVDELSGYALGGNNCGKGFSETRVVIN